MVSGFVRLTILGLAVVAFGCEPSLETEDATVKQDTEKPDVGKIDASVDAAVPDVAPDVLVDTSTGCEHDSECKTDLPCVVGVCNADGSCSVKAVADGTLCDDGDECTESKCEAGQCVSGAPDPECKPCTSNAECPDESYCAMDSCRGEGKCAPRPFGCPDNYAPVCGCDGNDYGNACEAASAGVTVEKDGKCSCPELNDGDGCPVGTSPLDSNGDGCADICVGKCETLCDCYANEALSFEGQCPLKCAGCGDFWACEVPADGGSGICTQKCGFVPDEVASCDGSTGGCKSNADCLDGEYCAKKDESCGSLGECAPLPEECALIAAPVCGCDGKTWSNACFAAANGVNVAAEGPCDSTCGGFAGVACPGEQWCDPEPGMCNVSDVAGSCVDLESCSKEYDPVCGCDGQTYPTDCARVLAKIAKAHAGPCGCEPVICSVGSVATDTDGDECPDSCLPCPAIKCAVGTTATDSDGDGCYDNCVATACEADADCGEGAYCFKKSCGAASGQCKAKPEFCTEQYDPVCGCDGQTWGNACEAAAAGQNIDYEGQCQSKCGTILGIPCEEGQVCDFPAGSCNVSDNAGVCVELPLGCPDVWEPVCGCDGKTYSNDCDRLMAGVAKDHDGQCSCQVIIDCAPGYKPVDTDGDGCADQCKAIACTQNSDCGAFGGLYCAKEGCDGEGVCEPKPIICTKEYSPVCGCNGKTYGNACEAASAGANVSHKGACEKVCGGIAGTPCADGEFCEMDSCGVLDGQGQCMPVPDACVAVFDPVCGCDGKTYSNDCVRQQAGASKAYDGACTCTSNDDCAAGSYCSAETCGDAGTCQAKPSKCTKILAPVCGCDGQTWGNACFAASAGVSVAHTGACEPAVTPCESNEDCDADSYCASADGACGGGECAPKPDACSLVYDPVCGCDGKTWGNACAAAAAGVSVAKKGACETTCGGFAGIECPDGMWCDPDAGMCNVADGTGTCRGLESCSKEYAPVCGCDGQTYPTDCARVLAKIAKDHDGPCECVPILCEQGTTPADTDGDGCNDACKPCPQILCAPGTTPVDSNNDGCFDSCKPVACDADTECGDGQHCATEACGEAGTCQPKPEACTKEYDPVCGCDGETYGNACLAALAGANVAKDGECTVQCGGFVGLPCPDGSYCQFEAGACGAADFFGICVPKPDGCPDVWEPVCGCDGQTYGNQCELEAAGAQKDHDGTCGCLIIIDCAPGYYPVDSDGDGCADTCKPTVCGGNADCAADYLYCKRESCGGEGTCALKPDSCPKIYTPVCGCNGKTYGNACEAAAAGATVASEGACTSTCGGLGGATCPDGEFCDYAAGTCGIKGATGTCVVKPQACVDLYAPVCGCDGVTYSNDCYRQLAGVGKSHDGVCACQENAHCGDAMFCQKDGCDGSGQCEPRPTGCTTIYSPVCGCDGKTYPNTCSAHAAGVNVSKKGSCDEVVICETSADCAAQGIDGWCSKPEGNCGGAGTCEPLPDGCPDVWEPVCGCDGTTWSNACDAAVEGGVSVAYEGECAPQECEHSEQCTEGHYCKKDGCSGVGTCEPMPEICPLAYIPVCGCDGKTYQNACAAGAAGVNVEHTGACQTPTCESNAQCADTQFCKKASCDGKGECVDRPTACPDVYAPVCGCSGKTWGNSCEAAAAGDNVAYNGECQVNVLCKSNDQCAAGEYCAKESCDGFGTCSAKPQACIDLWKPVCGCDGKTWSNTCYAANAGVNVAYEGECQEAACEANEQCAAGQYCELGFGSCGGSGKCVDKPLGCPDVWAPVCGCDGETYGNTCEAAAAGATIASDGACEATCESDADCVDAAGNVAGYCAKPAGDCDGVGKCTGKPDACPDVWAPVCTCNGETVSNTCYAAAAGQNVAHDGKCETGGETCATNDECSDGFYCAKPGCTDAGTCQAQPDVCPDVYSPVCGCDGKTYGNTCDAAAAGMSVSYKGECNPLTTLCESDSQCKDGQFCQFEAGQCDGLGTCTDKPVDCIQVYAPVCGCDGATWANSCQASAAGVSVLYDGPCKCPQILCVDGWVPADTDGDGCPDTCKPPCDVAIKCAVGYVAVDTDGDGCNDECKLGCESACDCYDAGLDFETPCAALCPTCDNFWACDAGVCEAKCGPVSEEASECTQCGPIVCKAPKAPVDTDGDGCADECQCKLLPCPLGSKPTDTDGDGCPDECVAVCTIQILCEPGYLPTDTDGDACDDKCVKACDDIVCPTGWTGVDTDNDGCADTCEGCPVAIDCAPGFKPIDSDGDGCVDECRAVCESACDCYDALGQQFPSACELDCATCDNYWTCSEGLCEPMCGAVPDDVTACGCKDLVCDVDQVGKDTNNDNCIDQCVCGPLPECPAGSKPLDTNGNGCIDSCGPVCEPFECADGMMPADSDNDGCPDTCKCAALVCPTGFEPVDTNGDNCPDTCDKQCTIQILCDVGYVPVDTDKDGCDDACECAEVIECPAGQIPADSNGDECADVCICKVVICPSGQEPIDTDNDDCPDTCSGGCDPVECTKEQVPVDTDGDECADTCACALAIDCAPGYQAVDTNDDGCDDACTCAEAIKCADGFQAVDSDGNGCPDTCVPANCQADADCELDGYFCLKPIGSCGGFGKCIPKNSECDPAGDGEPVCGCDGDTWESYCDAVKAGQNVASFGECKPTCEPFACDDSTQQAADLDGDGCPDTCVPANCQKDDECGADGWFCLKPMGSCDGFGKCVAQENACDPATDDGEAVCGCDGETYASYCKAQLQGVNVVSVGMCVGVTPTP